MTVLIHPGYPKCGSTFLQESLFALHSGCNLLQGFVPEAASPLHNGNFYRTLRNRPEYSVLRSAYHDVLEPQLQTDRVNVYSAESMLMGAGAFDDILPNIHGLIPDATVLIVMRPQIDILRSWYDMAPYASRDPRRELLPFSVWLKEALTSGNPKFDHDFARSARFVDVLEAYRKTFGAEQVFAYSLQRFLQDAESRGIFLDRLNLDRAEAADLLATTPRNSHSKYRFRKIARKILGPVRASSFLSYGQIQWLGRQINRLTPDKATAPSPQDLALVERTFAGQDLAALQACKWRGVFV